MSASLLTARNVADQLGLTPETILAWVRQGKLPAFRLPSGQIRFTRETLAELEKLEPGEVPDLGPKEDPPRWIYAIQADGYRGDIKIGITRDPRARLHQLQVGTSQELRGIAAFPGTAADEKAIHEMYADLRIRGEWFMHSLPLYHFVTDLGGAFRWKR